MAESDLDTEEQVQTIWHLGGLTYNQLGRRVWKEIDHDNVLTYGSALAYSFLLAGFGSRARAVEVAEGLMQRGLVPRTFGESHPLADHLRVTVRDTDENDRLIAAARELALPAAVGTP